MNLISEDEKEIGNLLNEKRKNALVDLYHEAEFFATGYLVTDCEIYHYGFKISFSNQTHNFRMRHFLYAFDKKLDVEAFKENIHNLVEKSNDKSDNVLITITFDNINCELYDLETFEKIVKYIEE